MAQSSHMDFLQKVHVLAFGVMSLFRHAQALGSSGRRGWTRKSGVESPPSKNDAPRFPGARVSSDQAVRLAAAGTAVAGAAFAAAVGAGAGSRGRGREGQGGDRQKCEEEFFHFLNLR